VLQSVAVCCSLLQRVAVVTQAAEEAAHFLLEVESFSGVLQCAAVCCSVLQSVAVCCSLLQRVAVVTQAVDTAARLLS